MNPKMHEIDAEALRMFRIVNGKGDDGSEREFWCQNPAKIKGWKRLAKNVLKRIDKAEQPVFGPRSIDC